MATPGSASIATATTQPLWLDQLGFDVSPEGAGANQLRPAVAGDSQVDVAIIGGGFSGLWTAYYLIKQDPTLRIQVIERHFCGYGASGRNGGWAVGELAGAFEKYAKRSSQDGALRQAREVFKSVDEIGRVAEAEGIECGFAKGGTIRLARNSPQADRQRDEIDHERSNGFTEAELCLLDADQARTYLNATRVAGGIYFPHSAALNPAQLVRGLATVVENAGVSIAEGTTVTAIDEPIVRTDRGTVRADVVVQATEAYTRDLEGQRRDLLPVYSLMIATEPLPASVFDEIGLHDRPTFADDRFMVIYGQRTADDRIAFGGRGVPYLFGSHIDRKAELHLQSHQLIQSTLVEMLPAVASARITHRWGGVLGIPRDWVPGLRFDRAAGRGVLGGYVGEGVAAANLAGRTMADLVLGHETDRTLLPWVGHRSRRWEPEPLRFVGVRSSRRLLAAADKREDTTDKPATAAFKISRLLRGA
ncbi:MAG: NAD(P)/FAD-dependent oxidoreductase [Acidimicrobiia bacterium]